MTNRIKLGGSSANALGPVRDLEPFLDYYWEIASPTLPEVADVDLPSFLVKGIDLPFPKFNPETVFGGGQNKFYAGNMDVDQFTITFNENYEVAVAYYINNWLLHIKDHLGIFSLPRGADGYKKDMQVILFGPDGVQVYSVELEGIWPVSMDNMTLGTQGTPIELAVQFSVDRIIW